MVKKTIWVSLICGILIIIGVHVNPRVSNINKTTSVTIIISSI